MTNANDCSIFSSGGTVVALEKMPSKSRKTDLKTGADPTVVPFTSKGAQGEKAPCPAPSRLDPKFLNDLADLSAMELRRKYRKEANSHRNMKDRLKDKSVPVHPDFNSFRDFLRHVGPIPAKGATLDRINNDDPEYALGKVRWADKRTQNGNKGDSLAFYDPKTGNTYTTSQLAAMQGVSAAAIRKRRLRHWSDVDTIAGAKTRALPASAKPLHPDIDELAHVWRDACREAFPDMIALPFTGKERGFMNAFAKQMTCSPIPAATVIATCIAHWSEFSGMSKGYQAAWGFTEVPTVEFFCRFSLAAVNFTKQHMPEVEMIAADAKRSWLLSQL